MSTFPLISHHLFVSAVGHDAVSEGEPAFSPPSAPAAGEVPLEIIDAASEIPSEPGRARRTTLRTRARSIS